MPRGAIGVIVRAPSDIWDIDADDYTDEKCELVLETARQIRASFPEGDSDTLVTKVMLGVFGCVPAFDTYFRKGLGVGSLNRQSLRKISQFYEANSDLIDSYEVSTLDFDTGLDSGRRYTSAKKIDMSSS
jgi:hypothetical protein